MKNLLRLVYEKILFLTRVNLRGITMVFKVPLILVIMNSYDF